MQPKLAMKVVKIPKKRADNLLNSKQTNKIWPLQ